jgi:hypothetical protein
MNTEFRLNSAGIGGRSTVAAFREGEAVDLRHDSPARGWE